jgi:hypothetical protein
MQRAMRAILTVLRIEVTGIIARNNLFVIRRRPGHGAALTPTERDNFENETN